MKIKFGALVVAGSGKIGGHVASRNRYGAYMRTKVTPVNPQTSAQTAVRNRLAQLSQAWKSLTAASRASFNAAVSDFQKTDVFGDLKTPSGFNLYQRLNNNILTVGGSVITTPPSPVEVAQELLTVLIITGGSTQIEAVLSGSVPASSEMKLFATPPVSPGVSFVKSEYRLISIIANGSSSQVDFSADYVAKFGEIPVGQKVFCKVVFTDPLTGLESLPQSVSNIAVAL